MFVDQTVGGVLAKRLQETEDRLADITGYRVRISETSGSQLCRLLPNTNPWSGQDCLRLDCYTCGQQGEKFEDCKTRNVLYESVCVLCNKEVLEKKNLSKWDEFRDMVGVYVGETARSLYERAGEHWQDVKAGKLESHMLKHWHTEHVQEAGEPKFKIRLVKTFGDALSRQKSESVRIDLRGENVINSKTEYSRCRLPRLAIDKNEWRVAKDKENKLLEEDSLDGKQDDKETRLEEELMSSWHNKRERSTLKRKMTESGASKAKKKKLDPLVDWGMTKLEDDSRDDIRKWLGGSEVEQKQENVEVLVVAEVSKPTKKLKQMEIAFSRILEDPVVVESETMGLEVEVLEDIVDTEEKRPEVPKIQGSINKKRKLTLKQIAKGNRKMTGWLVDGVNVVAKESGGNHVEVEMEVDYPELEEPEVIIRRELAKTKRLEWQVKYMSNKLVLEMVDSVVARSVVDSVMVNVEDKNK
jgi:Uri superfamily endonuclease